MNDDMRVCFVCSKTTASTTRSAATWMSPQVPSELNSDHVDEAMSVLRRHHEDIFSGLQSPIVGQALQHKSLPKFLAAGNKRFVQIFNTGDHWVCATNVFSSSTHVVYVYDSMYSHVSDSLVLQVSSLLREEDYPDEVEFVVRHFKQQTIGTRICGFYAVAACVACVLREDPTGRLYDEVAMGEAYVKLINQGVIEPFPSQAVECCDPMPSVKRRKLHCLCHKPFTGSMIQCDSCKYWFHMKNCVREPATPRTLRGVVWKCPCCSR